jgi:hypothetical protein
MTVPLTSMERALTAADDEDVPPAGGWQPAASIITTIITNRSHLGMPA